MELQDVFVALGIVMAFEGLLYGLFPNAMQRAMAYMLQMPPEQLRYTGLGMATIGVALIWFLTKVMA